jgi:hypothetical protein
MPRSDDVLESDVLAECLPALACLQSDDYSSCPKRGDMFTTLELLEQKLQPIAQQYGFSIARTTNSFSELTSIDLFQVEQGVRVTQRGKFYCTFKDQESKANPKIKTTCSWEVPFTFVRTNRSYIIKPPCYVHNHSLDDVNITANGLTTISLLNQMRPAEIQLATSLAKYNLDLSKVREILEGTNPGRTYAMPLLARLLEKGKTMHLGEDPHSMTKFMEFGFSLRAKGGVFNFELSNEQQLCVAYMQTHRMQQYAKQFNDFVIIDGTHNVCMYDLRLLPYTVVCSLGKMLVNSN